MNLRRRLLVLSLTSMLVVASGAAAVPVPLLTGTSPGGAFITPPSALTLSDFGYVEEEFFVTGTARAYSAATPLSMDGKWTASPDGPTAAYTTRILVRRPVSPSKFNGTVVLEWLNVSGGVDAAPDWTFLHPLLKRKGYAWVGVSAQFQGVAGTGGPLGFSFALKSVNPVRYGPLVHPGDTFSYDIFSQVAAALRQPGTPSALGNLRPKRVIAIGESQSAFRMVTYVNAIHPDTQLYDGFLIHSRGVGGAPLSQSPEATIAAPSPSFVRTDVDVPVLIFEAETDLITLGYFDARQDDVGNIRTWEVAGTAHFDAYGLGVGPDDAGRAAIDTTYTPPVTSVFGVIECESAINAGPQHYVLSAALARLDQWVRRGRVRGGPVAPRLQISAGPPPTIERDPLGNALGGIRTPQLDVPIAALSGLGQTGSAFCSLFGTTVPFDDATLASLYPTHRNYVSKVNRALRKAVKAGYILKTDGAAILAGARASSIGR